MSWRIAWRGKTWAEADLTVAHLAAIVETQGDDRWEFINPFGGPLRLLGVLASLIAVDAQRPVAEVLAELRYAPAAELLAALSTTDDDDEDPDDEDPAAAEWEAPIPAPAAV